LAERKGLAITALVLGIVGLFTAGGLGIGSLLGVALAGAALVGVSRGGRDIAWAALAANVLALLTLLPVGAAVLAYRASPLALDSDDALPEPAQNRSAPAFVEAPPPPPPPPPSARSKPQAPIRIGGTIQEPRKTRNVSPVYPPDAIQARVQGVVILECTISPTGKVVQVKPLRGIPLLTEAAIEAVRQWEYTPTELNGVPVPVIMTVTVNFKLS
jgi:TonB family protein